MDDTDPCGDIVSRFPGVFCEVYRPKPMNHKIYADGKQGGDDHGDRNINRDWKGEHNHRQTREN
jgi:hypothetical protein